MATPSKIFSTGSLLQSLIVNKLFILTISFNPIKNKIMATLKKYFQQPLEGFNHAVIIVIVLVN